MTKDTYVETNHAAKETRHVLGGQTVSAAAYNNGIRPNDQEADEAPAEDETTPENNWQAANAVFDRYEESRVTSMRDVQPAPVFANEAEATVDMLRRARETICSTAMANQHIVLAAIDRAYALIRATHEAGSR